MSKKFKFHSYLTSKTVILHEDLRKFMIISRWCLLRMWKVSDKSRIENQNPRLIYRFIFQVVPFMR